MDHKCPKCKKVIAKEDMRFKKSRKIKAVFPAFFSNNGGQAVKVYCGCGRALIILRGTLI